MKRKYPLKVKVVLALVGLILLLAGSIIQPIYFPTKDQALNQFQIGYGIPSENLYLDPLIRAGEKVVPSIIEMVNDKKMVRRTTGIRFLGNGVYREALPTLEKIVQDQSEDIRDRGKALHSIYLIDESTGQQYAQQYKNEPASLGKIAGDILDRKNYLKKRRTYWQAMQGKIDDWCCTENDLTSIAPERGRQAVSK